jgi:protein-disulfide isomerase
VSDKGDRGHEDKRGSKRGGGGSETGRQGSGRQGSGKRAARDRLAAERAQRQQAESRRRKGSNILIAVVVVVVVAGIVGYAWWASQDEGPTGAALPSLVQESGGGVVLGDGPVDVTLWEDFQCPGCKAFEASNGEMLQQRVDDGDITMTIHPLSFLDAKVGNESSSLAANAFGCATDAGQQQALDFHLTVYGNQPEETPGQDAWTAEQLIGWGNDSGIAGSEWESCVNDMPYAGWVTQVQTTMGNEGISQTPTVFLDGKEFDLSQGDLGAAIDQALAGDQ